MLIDSTLLDNLTEEARRSPRLRMNYDLRNSSGDGSHRMLNAMICVVPINAWHNSESLETGTIIFEAKDGAYEPLGDEDILKR